MKRRAMIHISSEQLARALHLRDGIEILRVRMNFKIETLEVIITGPDLPEVDRGCEPRRLSRADVSEFGEP